VKFFGLDDPSPQNLDLGAPTQIHINLKSGDRSMRGGYGMDPGFFAPDFSQKRKTAAHFLLFIRFFVR